MNQSSKLFLAAVLLAVGYGVAHMLGSPNAPYLTSAPSANRIAPQSVAVFRQPVSEPRSNPNLVGTARLLPDSSSNESATAKDTQAKSTPPIATIAKSPEPPRLITLPTDTTSIAAAPPAVDPTIVQKSTLPASQPPVVEPVLQISPPANILTAVSPVPSEQPVSAAFTANEWKPAGASQTAFNSPVVSPVVEQQSTVSPPPWPAESVTMRTHLIVDGDSLAKLAGRYLNNPQRSDEIFALNRNVLTSPELLPIGAEIRIPARQGMRTDDEPPPFASPSAMSVTPAGQRGMVPISPVPTMSADVPRARLLGPVPVESPRAATQPSGY